MGYLRAVLALAILALGPVSQPVVAQPAAGHPAGAAVALAPRLHFSAQEMALAEAAADIPDLAAFYGAHGLRPVFLGPEAGIRRQALREAVAGAPGHGIPLSRYAPETLDESGGDLQSEIAFGRVLARYLRDMTGGVIRPSDADRQIHREPRRPAIADLIASFAGAADPAAVLHASVPDHPAYRALQRALGADGSLVVPAHLPPAPERLWRAGQRDEALLPLRARLAAIGFSAPAEDPALYDAALADVVAQYQAAAGLTADGIAGPITIRRLNGEDDAAGDPRRRAVQVALERLRWMAGEDLDQRHVWVNVPEYTARIVENGQQLFQTRTIVGHTDDHMRTPEFSDRIQYVVVNPRWNVPRSITVRDYLPRLKANRHAVPHLDVVDGRGNVVPRDRIDFSRYTAANFPYRMRQQPGDDNALGLVKFIFPNRWNIYLHDTPTRHLFGNRQRAYSNGCIRIADPFDLAYQLLSVQAADPQAMFQRALAGGRERWLTLDPPVPVHLVYFTAWPDETGQIRLHTDIYGRDAQIWERLQRAAG